MPDISIVEANGAIAQAERLVDVVDRMLTNDANRDS
jgi:hypothetical protein